LLHLTPIHAALNRLRIGISGELDGPQLKVKTLAKIDFIT
jgi:hypothetical protein